MDSTQFFNSNDNNSLNVPTPVNPGKKNSRKSDIKNLFRFPKDARLPLTIGILLALFSVYVWFNPPLDARERTVLQIDAIQRAYGEVSLEAQQTWNEWEALSQELVNLHDQAETLRSSPVFQTVTE